MRLSKLDQAYKYLYALLTISKDFAERINLLRIKHDIVVKPPVVEDYDPEKSISTNKEEVRTDPNIKKYTEWARRRASHENLKGDQDFVSLMEDYFIPENLWSRFSLYLFSQKRSDILNDQIIYKLTNNTYSDSSQLKANTFLPQVVLTVPANITKTRLLEFWTEYTNEKFDFVWSKDDFDDKSGAWQGDGAVFDFCVACVRMNLTNFPKKEEQGELESRYGISSSKFTDNRNRMKEKISLAREQVKILQKWQEYR